MRADIAELERAPTNWTVDVPILGRVTGRPDVRIDNVTEVYEFYRNLRTDPKLTLAALGIMAMRVKPTFDEESTRGVKAFQLVGERLQRGGQIVIAANHQSDKEAEALGSTLFRRKEFALMRTKGTIPSKPDVFGQGIERWCIDAVGALPLWRSGYDLPENDPRLGPAFRAHSEVLNQRIVELGHSLGIFPEGHRNDTDDLRTILEVSGGTEYLIKKANRELDIPLLLLVLGIHYPLVEKDGGMERDFRHPIVSAGIPIDTGEIPRKRGHLTEVLSGEMQRLSNRAYDLALAA